MTTTTTNRKTTVVTEVPDERRWQGRDWAKALVAGGLALSLLRPGATTAPAVLPTAAAATALPAIISTVLPTVAPPAAAAPVISIAGAATQAGPITIEGTGAPGALVEVLVNGEPVGTATVGADGRWSLPAVLAAGTAEVVARTVDAAGAVLAEAEPVALEVGAALGGGEVVVPTFNAPPGDFVGGPALLTGTGAPGSRVRVRVGDVDYGTVVVGPDGNWELDAILTAGTFPVVVDAVDASGAVVATADPVEINVVGGLGVTLDEPVEGAELEPGPVTMSGNGQPGTVLEILDGDRVLGEVTVGADGTWTTEVPLEVGTAAITVREQGSDQILTRPIRVIVGDAPAVAAGCGTALTVGCPAWVTRAGGLQLRIRSTPTINADNIITRLPIGTGMTIEEGPQSADGFTWWRVTTVGGNTGWVAGENLVVQPD